MELKDLQDRAGARLKGAGEAAAKSVGRLKLAKAVAVLLEGEEKDAQKPEYLGALAGVAGKEAVATAVEDVALQEKGAEHIVGGITDLGNIIQQETKPLLEQAANAIDKDRKPIYEQIKTKLQNPSDPVLKKLLFGLASRLLSFGVTATSWISAAFIDRLTGRDEHVDNQTNLQRYTTSCTGTGGTRTSTSNTLTYESTRYTPKISQRDSKTP